MLLLHNNIYRDFLHKTKNPQKEDSLMKNVFDIILENFQLILTALFCLLICFMTGQFGWALIFGIIFGIVLILIFISYWKERRARNSYQHKFRKWTRGK